MSDKSPKCPNTPKYPCGGCPVCQVPPAAARPWSWPPGFHEAWPTREAIAAHQGGVGRWLVTDPYGVKTLGAFDGDTFHVLMRWHVAGELATAPGQPWKFEPYAPNQAAPAPPAASNSPSQPQAPTPPEGPAAGPGIAPGLDAAGFGSWPSEEEIRAHEPNFWLARQGGAMMALGWFCGDAFLTTNKQGRSAEIDEIVVLKRDAKHWTFCPIDDNGDKLDAAPVLRGEDARRLAEQLGQVAPPEEIARRRAEARRRLAESEAGAERLPVEPAPKMKPPERLPAGAWQPPRDATIKAMTGDLERQQDALKALNLRPLTKADRCPRCDDIVPCPRCPPSGLPKARPLVTESLGSGMEAPVFKDEHVRMTVDAKAKYAVPVGPAGFENDRIGRLTEEEKEIDRRLRDGLTTWKRQKQQQEPAVAHILATLPERSPDRRVLVVLRGLPGSGKSTVAQAIVDSDPGRWARVSKDDVRQMMVGPSGDLFRFVEDRAREVVVAKTADEMAMSALRLGLDVVVDATNLTNRALNSWHLAAMVVNRDGHGPVLVCERAVPTPIEECVARDARRGAKSVGRAVIERLAATIDIPLEDRNQEVGQ